MEDDLMDKQEEDLSGTQPNAWDAACSYQIARPDPYSGRLEVLNPRTNFFVESLELLGAKTFSSDWEHAHEFGIAFQASYELALAVERTGFFSVHLSTRPYVWRISLMGNESFRSDSERRCCLRSAATTWIREFPLTALTPSDSFYAFITAHLARRRRRREWIQAMTAGRKTAAVTPQNGA
jgi:hypothetical protein